MLGNLSPLIDETVRDCVDRTEVDILLVANTLVLIKLFTIIVLTLKSVTGNLAPLIDETPKSDETPTDCVTIEDVPIK